MLAHQPLLQLRGIAKGFRAGIAGCMATMRVLEHVDLDVSAAECVALQGKRGSGKTTLLLCAAGLMRPDRGTVHRRESSSASETACIVHYVASRHELVWHRAKSATPTVLLVDDAHSDAGAPWSAEMDSLLERVRCDGGAVVVVGNGDALQRVATRTIHLARGRLFLVSRHPATDSVPARVAEG